MVDHPQQPPAPPIEPIMHVMQTHGNVYARKAVESFNGKPEDGSLDERNLLLFWWLPQHMRRATNELEAMEHFARAMNMPLGEVGTWALVEHYDRRNGNRTSHAIQTANVVFWTTLQERGTSEEDARVLYAEHLWAYTQWVDRLYNLHRAVEPGMDLYAWIFWYTHSVVTTGAFPQGNPITNDAELFKTLLAEAKAYQRAVDFYCGLDWGHSTTHLYEHPYESANVPVSPEVN
jgi:hypothetical protein